MPETDEKTILRETLAAICDILGPEHDGLTVERTLIGLFFRGEAQQRHCRGLRDPNQDDPRGGLLSDIGDGDAVSRQAAWPPGPRPCQGGARRSRYPPGRRDRGDERSRGYLLAPPSAPRDRAAPRH